MGGKTTKTAIAVEWQIKKSIAFGYSNPRPGLLVNSSKQSSPKPNLTLGPIVGVGILRELISVDIGINKVGMAFQSTGSFDNPHFFESKVFPQPNTRGICREN